MFSRAGAPEPECSSCKERRPWRRANASCRKPNQPRHVDAFAIGFETSAHSVWLFAAIRSLSQANSEPGMAGPRGEKEQDLKKRFLDAPATNQSSPFPVEMDDDRIVFCAAKSGP